MRILTLAIVAILVCPIAVQAKPPQTAARLPEVNGDMFRRDILPLLQSKCLGCHGVGQTRSKLDLRSLAAATRGGSHGPAIVPGKSRKSLLFQHVTGTVTPRMPPLEPLAATQIELLKRWIDGGAPWPGSPIETAGKQVWWSFRPVISPKMPAASRDKWVRTPVDAFVLDKMRSAGITPAPPASRRVWMRRAYLDMVGLPPTPEEIESFERDNAPDAFERVVDRLLASKHYGERWGRHWLDLVRYADSGGFEGDRDRQFAYRYRDYVIDAFNNDKPYNRFIREQIAGDEIQPTTPESLIATGYLAAGPQDIVMNNARNRSDELDDLVSTTGSVFLGLTVTCARCHDHKYDPVSQLDYYRLSALFAPTVRKDIAINSPEEAAAARERTAMIDRSVAAERAEWDRLREKALPEARKNNGLTPTEDQIINSLSEPERGRARTLSAALRMAESQKVQPITAYGVTDKAASYGKCFLLVRGDADHPGQEVQPGLIKALSDRDGDVAPKATAETTGRRTALADWLTSEKNPLTARVWVNRLWRWHFGRGIVNTPSNLGFTGDMPTHPELLEWLSTQLVKDGWRIKPLHRMILLSSTYRQSNEIRPEPVKTDPQNKLFWRMPVRRLEGEVIRDSILTVAGTLNPTMYGPPVFPPVDPTLRADTFQGMNWPEGEDSPKTWRRSVYVKVKRSLLLPQLEVFDCPEITYSVGQRNTTTTPLQALMLLNDPLILRQSRLFAERVVNEAGNQPNVQIDRAYRLALGRSPSPREMGMSLNYLKGHSLRELCQALFNLNEFVYSP